MSDLFQDVAMPALATKRRMVSIAPSFNMGYVGATMRPVEPFGWRSASTAPALVLPLPRPPTNRRNRASLAQNARWGDVCDWCRIVSGEVDDVVVGACSGVYIVRFSVARVELLQ